MTVVALAWSLASVAMATNPASLLRAAREEARAGAWSKAEKLLVRVEEGARLLDDPSLELAARVTRIDLRLTAEEFDSAYALLPVLPRRSISTADSAVWHLARARVALARGDIPAAKTAAEEASGAAKRADEDPLTSVASAVLGRVLLASGDLEGATKAWKRARSDADGVPALDANAATLEARIELAGNHSTKASKAIEISLRLWRSQQDVGGILGALPVRAQLALADRDTGAAREAWDAAAHIAEETGLPRTAIRARLMAASASPSCASARIDRVREILKASGLTESQLPTDLQPLLK